MNKDSTFDRIVPENIFNSGDLKVLICYMLSAIDEPVPATETAQLFHYEGIANYFDTQTAIYDLEQNGYIAPHNNSKDLFKITQKGKNLSQTLKESISIALRTKVYNAVLKMLTRYKYERDTDIVIENNESGSLLTFKMTSCETTLFSYSLLLPNESQALALREQILKDPKYYYDSFIKLLTEDIPLESKDKE